MTLAHLQGIADLTAKFLGLIIRPQVRILPVTRGTAYTEEGWFSIPEWVLQKSENFITYYVVHEVCHFWRGCTLHGPEFTKIENKALAYWGLYIKRKKIYPKSLQLGPYKNEK